ncbi:MAG: hypothetical protein WBD28_08430 [Candidatus Zixiibacteriota bacterium]
MRKIELIFLTLFTLLVSDSQTKGLKPGDDVGRFKPAAASDSIEPQHRVHRRGNVNFCISNWGYLGSMNRDINESPGCLFCDHPDSEVHAPSFEFPAGSDLEYLFQGALWIGGVVEGETLVTVGADGWYWIYEFTSSSDIKESGGIRQGGIHDQECISIFADTADPALPYQWWEFPGWDLRRHKPLNVEVTQKSYSWENPPYDDFIILDYTLKNIGDKLISNAYLGFYLDPDIFLLSENPYSPT